MANFTAEIEVFFLNNRKQGKEFAPIYVQTIVLWDCTALF
jgi:hypothetical protein